MLKFYTLICLVLFSFTDSYSLPFPFFNSIQVEREAQDSSEKKTTPHEKRSFIIPNDKHYSDLIELQIFYSGQLRKEHVPEKYKVKYKADLIKIETEINELKLAKNPGLTEEEKLELLKPSDEVEIASWIPPVVLAHELGSTVYGLGVSYLGGKYSFPTLFYADKVFDEQYSFGGYIGYFEEHLRSGKSLPEPNTFYEYNRLNYSYSYITIGVRGMYHFLNPKSPVKMERLSPVIWDLYGVANLGFNIPSSPLAFIKNNLYTDSPSKEGLNYGIAVGMRYMFDDNVGAFAELGYSRIGYATIGISYSYRKGPKKLIPPPVVEDKDKSKSKSGKGSSKSKKKR